MSQPRAQNQNTEWLNLKDGGKKPEEIKKKSKNKTVGKTKGEENQPVDGNTAPGFILWLKGEASGEV